MPGDRVLSRGSARSAFVLVALCWLIGSAAAAPRTVKGVVVREETARPVVGASVLSDRGEIAITDDDGYFALVVRDGDRELTVVATGFSTKSVPITTAPLMRIVLEAASGAEVIEVSDKAPEETKPLSYQLSVDEIRTIPGAGNDILRAATILPGVARIPFSFGGLVLRGTSPRDTAIYLDGVEVPIAFHFGGVTSFYPGGMLESLSVTASGYDSSFGRAQGGIVSITTREPRADRFRMGGSIGLFDSSVQAEGPVKGGGFLVGLRRSYLDAVVRPFVEPDDPLPSYWDFQIRTTWGDPRRRGRITPMIFSSIDRVASDQTSVTSAFVRVAVPYLRQWGRTTLRVVPWIGTNRLSFADSEEEGYEQEFSRPVYVGGVRSEIVRDYKWGHLRGGIESHSGYLGVTMIGISSSGDDTELLGTSTISWSDLATFAETRIKIDGERFALKPGVRVEAYGLSGELVVNPRLNIHQKLTDRVTMRQSIGRYHQPPTAGDIDPREGNIDLDSSYYDQLTLGFDAELPSKLLLSATGYFSYGDQLGVRVRSPKPGSEDPEPNYGGLGPTFELLLEKQLGFAIYRDNVGRGRAYGLELSLKRNVGDLFWIASYTLARAERVDDPRQQLFWRPFELDQRHNLQLAVSRRWPKWRLGARLQVVSGNPYSPLRTVGPDDYEIVPWGGTLPTFVSIDLRADRRWHRCWGDIVFFVDVQNATNRKNVEAREANFDVEEDINGLPIIPFIGVEFQPLI